MNTKIPISYKAKIRLEIDWFAIIRHFMPNLKTDEEVMSFVKSVYNNKLPNITEATGLFWKYFRCEFVMVHDAASGIDTTWLIQRKMKGIWPYIDPLSAPASTIILGRGDESAVHGYLFENTDVVTDKDFRNFLGFLGKDGDPMPNKDYAQILNQRILLSPIDEIVGTRISFYKDKQSKEVWKGTSISKPTESDEVWRINILPYKPIVELLVKIQRELNKNKTKWIRSHGDCNPNHIIKKFPLEVQQIMDKCEVKYNLDNYTSDKIIKLNSGVEIYNAIDAWHEFKSNYYRLIISAELFLPDDYVE